MNFTNRMLLTPAKFHYTFIIRDLFSIVKVIIQVTPKKINTPDFAAAVWAPEFYRIFPNKFISKEDKNFFSTTIRKI
jgi:dynein heavy chain